MAEDAPFIHSVEVARPDAIDRSAFPWTLPPVAALADGVALDPKVTFLVGENGSGKSTLIEALAVAAGLNAEGGSSNFSFSTRDSHSGLSMSLRLKRSTRRPKTDFFLRAESFFTAATYLEKLGDERARPESATTRSPPTAAAPSTSSPTANPSSPSCCTASAPRASTSSMSPRPPSPPELPHLPPPHAPAGRPRQPVRRRHPLPILLAYPGATIYECGEDGLTRVDYDDAGPVSLTRGFLAAPERFLSLLMD